MTYRILKGVGVEPQYKGFRIKYLLISAGIFLFGLFGVIISFNFTSSILVLIIIGTITFSLIALMAYLSITWGKWGHIYFFIKTIRPVKYISGFKRPHLKIRNQK
jgi:hypothetical protein